LDEDEQRVGGAGAAAAYLNWGLRQVGG
jgi:hypothetical protein